MRTFVGIFPPPEVREVALARARKLSVSGGVRWTRPSNIHLTLKFLGDTPEDLLPRVRGVLEQVCGTYGPFSVRLSGFGGFPSEKRARVLWAGVGEGTEKLGALAAALEDALASAGLSRDPVDRGYVPHLTLGRCTRKPVRLEVAENAPEVEDFGVREVLLVKSELSRAGAVYSVLGSYPLSGVSAPKAADRE